jgi:hypothetical protein
VYLRGHRVARRPCSPGVGHPRRQRDFIGIADIDSDREVMGSALDQAITDWAHP